MDDLIKDLRWWAHRIEGWERHGLGKVTPPDLYKISLLMECAADTIERLRGQRDHAREMARSWGGVSFDYDGDE